ncbi:thioredoxin family protein [Maribrevibacterium harenarium]|uniref:Thioredoxin family protein n=1 Tax=Maribrevibacterium harenarium TaxID=2589817 RepID=A0A501W946_9GAMM|nr:thioredoxin family protein [Maribrevibacterium harenarium]
MLKIESAQALSDARNGASLILFGGEQCGVCHALKPKLQDMLSTEFPLVSGYYIDCHGRAAGTCAQERVFSLPVVQIWLEGKLFAEFSRVFSLGQVQAAIAHPYRLLFE